VPVLAPPDVDQHYIYFLFIFGRTENMRVAEYFPLAVALLPACQAQLHKLAEAHGIYFGSATDNYELNDAPYKAILSDGDEFGQTTPGNLQKWYASEPQQGVFDFSGGDQLADYAESEGMILRCHTLVWHSQLAPWGKTDLQALVLFATH
jgi:GH35 family endo-1,4-beta-xylanase